MLQKPHITWWRALNLVWDTSLEPRCAMAAVATSLLKQWYESLVNENIDSHVHLHMWIIDKKMGKQTWFHICNFEWVFWGLPMIHIWTFNSHIFKFLFFSFEPFTMYMEFLLKYIIIDIYHKTHTLFSLFVTLCSRNLFYEGKERERKGKK